MKSMLSKIEKVRGELSERTTIPLIYLPTLKERLVVACTLTNHRQRSTARRSRAVINSTYNRKQAQKVYLEVLDTTPQLFLPFLLAISPKATRSFDLSQLQQQGHSAPHQFHLSTSIKKLLETVAREQEINKSCYYEALLERLFPPG
jgi:hypothetical protein